MALGTDLLVYNKYAYTAMTEVIRQNLDLFNAATKGCMVLKTQPMQGDFDISSFYADAGDPVLERDAYSVSSTPLATIEMSMKENVSVKVGRGTKVYKYTPDQFKWIMQDQATTGAAYGQQLAKYTTRNMINTAVRALMAAMSTKTAMIYDATGDTPDTLSIKSLINAGYKMGDQNDQIVAWLAHSLSVRDYELNNASQTTNIFNFGNLNVQQDTHGRPFIISDISTLFTAGTPNIAYVLGLIPGAVEISLNNDMSTYNDVEMGIANPYHLVQTNWSFNIKIKGFAWDMANGGKSPTDAALFTQTNWDQICTDNKDLPCVILKTN